MTDYTESTHTPKDPAPTLGFMTGKLGGDPVHNRVQNAPKDGDLMGQFSDYFADKLRRIKRGEAIQVYPFRTHTAALADYDKFVRNRINVQLDMVEDTKDDGTTKIIAIPKLYKVKGGMKKEDAEKVSALSDEDNALTQWCLKQGYVFNTSAFYTPKEDVVMYMTVLVPTRIGE